MTVTSAQVTTLLENVLFESATLAAQNAPSYTAFASLNPALQTVAGLATYFANQPEAQIAERVIQYYQGALARVPSAFEISYYVQIAEAGLDYSHIAQGTAGVSLATWQTIANDFAASSEFTHDFGLTGGVTAATAPLIVSGFYSNILGRNASATEIAFYANELNSGVSASALLQQFTESPEYQGKANPTIQGNLSNNGTTAVTTVAAGGDPLAQGGAPIGTLPPTGTVGTSFSLTTGVDTQTANTFSAVLSGTASLNTLNAFDHLTGGGGSANTLSINSDGSAIPAGITLSNIQTISINALADQSVSAVASGSWTGVTNLNIVQAAGVSAPANVVGGVTGVSVTAPSTAALSDTGLVLGSGTAEFTGLSVDGGTSVTISATASDHANDGTNNGNFIGDVVIGGNTAPTGAVSLTLTETAGLANAAVGGVTVNGGTDVTVNFTLKDKVALAASTGAATSNQANTIVVTGATGAVTVNDALSVTSAATIATHANAVNVTGGLTVTVNETVAQTQSATGVSSVTEGAVSVTGDSTTTTVTVTQANVATGNLAQKAAAAIVGVSGVTAVTAAAGVEAVAARQAVNAGNSVAATSAATGVATVLADGAVTIADAKNTSTATSTITTVALSGYGNSTFAGSALKSLSLSGTGGTLTITNGAAATATNTTLALSVNALSDTGAGGADNHIVDTNNEITTLNVTTGAKNSSLDGFYDSGLKTLNVSGASVLKLGANFSAANDAGLTTVAVTGAAGLSANLSSFGAAVAVTTSSSGVMTLTLDDTTQTFVGSTGQDIISLAGDATKAITGGSATNNEVVLTATTAAAGNAAGLYTAANFGTKVTGFTTLGVNDATATNVNTYDLHGVFTGYTAIDLQSAMTGAQTFNGVASGTTLAIDAAETSVAYNLFTASSNATVNVAINKTSATAGITVGTLALNDSNGDGVANLVVASNNKFAAPAAGTGITNTITTLSDTSLTSLTVTGNAALAIGTLSLGNPGQAVPVGVASFSITDNTTAFSNTGSTHVAGSIGTLTDDTLGSLTFAGSNKFTIGSLVDNNAVNLTIANTGTGSATITTLSTDANAADVIHTGLSNLTFTGSGNTNIGTVTLVSNTAALTYTNSGTGSVHITALNDGTSLLTTTSLTLSGNIALGTAGTTTGGDTPVVFADTAGVTLAAGTDNSHISASFTGAAAGNTDTITVGNANNYIVDGSTAGTVKVTVGTGFDYIDVHTGGNNATYSATVTLGGHTDSSTAFDTILVSKTGSQAVGYSTTISGVAVGDQVVISGDAGQSNVLALSASQQSTITAAGSLAAAITAAYADLHTLTGHAAHDVMAFTYNGDTYVIDDTADTGAFVAGTDSIIHIQGVHTISQVTAAGAATFGIAS